MKKVSWCLKQKKGIELIEPNDNLSKAYFKEANETLQIIDEEKETKWNVIMAYYACYNSLYALLRQAGIKGEIHDCSISLMKYINEFSQQEIEFLMVLKEKRIQNQYYLKHEILENLNEVKRFVLKRQEISTAFDFNSLREVISNAKN